MLDETGGHVAPLPWQKAGNDFLPIDVDTHPIPDNPKKGEGDHFHHDFTFVGQASSEAPLQVQEEEVDGVKWVRFEELAQSPLERVRGLGPKLSLAESSAACVTGRPYQVDLLICTTQAGTRTSKKALP